ncbi:metal-sensitive transcriptional regulator [Sinomonas sp.]|uniref:metal-sensitive transcriptional regulator n=1 Tax=Sinomonas sp. TaxID=1914986 RepID=UPI002FE18D62
MKDTGRPDPLELRKLANRLKRAQGQLGAVIGAVEAGADCRAVITQLAAVRGALDKAGFELISTAMRDCLASPPSAGSEPGEGVLTMEELRRLFLTLA